MQTVKPTQESHFQVPVSLYSSLAFRTLPPSALKLWVGLLCQVNTCNNGMLDATFPPRRSKRIPPKRRTTKLLRWAGSPAQILLAAQIDAHA